jgi:hypothetical protein
MLTLHALRRTVITPIGPFPPDRNRAPVRFPPLCLGRVSDFRLRPSWIGKKFPTLGENVT